MAEDHNHSIPLAPPKIYPRSDAESVITKPRQKKSSKCFVFILSSIVLLSIAFLVFGLVVLRINSPKVKISQVEINNLRHTNNSLNMTMVAELTIKNTNFGQFKFENGSSTTVWYGNTIIGTRNINGGRVKARQTQLLNVIMEIQANGFGGNGNLSSEIGSDFVKFSCFAKLRGEIRVLKKVTRRRTAIMNCTMTLKLSTQEIQDLQCM